MNKRTEIITKIVETAKSHVGYRSRPLKSSVFGASLNMDGQTWAGAFIETVFRDAGVLSEPAQTSTVSSLAEYVRLNRIFRTPKPGDLAYLAFSTDGPFTQPQVVLVTDTSKWKLTASFSAVGGQLSSGLPRGPQESDGVYLRKFYQTDVLAFVRPKYGVKDRTAKKDNGKVVTARIDLLQPGKRNAQVLRLQQALAFTVGASGMTRGVYDDATASAVRRYQLRIGYTASEATGTPTVPMLQRLAFETQYAYLLAPVE